MSDQKAGDRSVLMYMLANSATIGHAFRDPWQVSNLEKEQKQKRRESSTAENNSCKSPSVLKNIKGARGKHEKQRNKKRQHKCGYACPQNTSVARVRR